MRSPQGRVQLYAVVVIVASLLDWLPKMDAMECFSTSDGRMVQFYCRPSELCCGSECCQNDAPFYTHWYFWLAVCMLLLVIVGVALSACRHFRKQRKYEQTCARNKPKFGVDLLLNYHLLRTDVISLPLYDDLVSRSPQTTTIPPPPLPHPLPHPLLSPPPYCDACANSSSSSNSSDNSRASRDPNDPPPPSYTECVMQD